MAHSSIAWEIAYTEGPGELPSMGSQKSLNNNKNNKDLNLGILRFSASPSCFYTWCSV